MPFALTPGADDGAPERLTGDDLATKREEELREVALRAQHAAHEAARSTPGTCVNCAQECLPLAVYCDEDCRGDHEARLRVRKGPAR